MKQIIIAVLMALISWFSGAAQPAFDANLLGIPPEVFDAAQSTVFTQSDKTNIDIQPVTSTSYYKGVKTVKTGYRIRLVKTRATSTSIYGLNHVYHYLHDYGYSYVGQNDTAFVFQNGNLKAYLKTSGTKHSFTTCVRYDDYGQFINRKLTKFSRAYIDSLSKANLGYGIDELERRTAQVWSGEPKDPSQFVTSIFGCITKDGDTYTNSTFINGKLYTTFNYQSLKMPWKKLDGTYAQLGELNFSWVLYNECAQPAVITDANSTGSMGECFRRMYTSFQPQSRSITVSPGSSYSANAQGNITYDSSKKALLQLVVHRNPMPDKNVEQEGYWYITSNARAYTITGL